mmetsp:Transcript_21232/g.59031  ORF Transcript_21232/g.59031 Transcript_21232/m.59031 type:complete len:238 (-) Transcript_21232:1654-2367(-)
MPRRAPNATFGRTSRTVIAGPAFLRRGEPREGPIPQEDASRNRDRDRSRGHQPVRGARGGTSGHHHRLPPVVLRLPARRRIGKAVGSILPTEPTTPLHPPPPNRQMVASANANASTNVRASASNAKRWAEATTKQTVTARMRKSKTTWIDSETLSRTIWDDSVNFWPNPWTAFSGEPTTMSMPTRKRTIRPVLILQKEEEETERSPGDGAVRNPGTTWWRRPGEATGRTGRKNAWIA